MKQLGAIILAAGLGKRMRSTQPKVLHSLAGKPLLSRVIAATQRLHPDRLVVVVGHKAEEVQRVCGGDGIVFYACNVNNAEPEMLFVRHNRHFATFRVIFLSLAEIRRY